MSIPRTPQQDADRMRNLLAFLLVGAFISVLPVFSFFVIPEANKDIITYMVGQLSGMATMALGFYFVNKVGQDATDLKRSENTSKAFEAIAATAKAAGGTGPDAAAAADEVAGAARDAADVIRDNAP